MTYSVKRNYVAARRDETTKHPRRAVVDAAASVPTVPPTASMSYRGTR